MRNRVAGLTLAVAVVLAALLTAQTHDRVRACADCRAPSLLDPLPPVPESEKRPGGGDPLPGPRTLQLDDGTCESGLGAGVPVEAFQQFQRPTGCFSPLFVLSVTSRINTGTVQSALVAQGAQAPPVGGFTQSRPIALGPQGPCPATAVTQAAFTTMQLSSDVFWVGLANTGFVGRDSNTPGNVWLNCATCGMTQYSPTTLSNLGLGGTWMLRVVVEPCVPVELLQFKID